MLEGPEIRRAADKIEAVHRGQTDREDHLRTRAAEKPTKALQGSTVVALETRGKALLKQFDASYTIYSYNQLYGFCGL